MPEPGAQEVRLNETPQVLEIKSASIPSEGHPLVNEDAALTIPQRNAFGVFDGLGGLAAGEEASALASEVIQTRINLNQPHTLSEAEQNLDRAVMEANSRVILEAKEHGKARMATTAAIVQVWIEPDGSKKAIIAHIGDSRVYFLRNAKLEPVTLDDSKYSGNPKKAWEIQKKLARADSARDLNREENKIFEERNIVTKAIGLSQSAKPTIRVIDIKAADVLIATTDGVHDNLTDHEIEEIINEAIERNSDPAEDLVAAARARSQEQGYGKRFRSKQDDMTAVVAIVKDEQGSPNAKAGRTLEDVVTGEHKIPVGAQITIRRSSGELESDWEFMAVKSDGKTVRVMKNTQGGINMRDVPVEEFRIMNPIPGILGVKTFDDLFKVLERVDFLEGSSNTYSGKQLIDTVNAVRKGKLDIIDVTRAGGLRMKVWDLLHQ